MTKTEVQPVDMIDSASAASSMGHGSCNDAPVSEAKGDEKGFNQPLSQQGSTAFGIQQPVMQPTPNQKSLGVVHPTGKMVWVPYHDRCTTLDTLKMDIAKSWGLSDTSFQVARATPLLGDALINMQCMPGEVLYLLPKVSSQSTTKPQEEQAQAAYGPQGQAYAPSTPTWSTTSSAPLSSHLQTSSIHSGTGAWFHLPLDEKIVHASHNLMKLVNNSKQCTELQANIETACALQIDCMPIFSKVEYHLQELISHPAGNYLVSKCFDFHPPLIELATELICRDLKAYALHKHASYVIEAILTHPNSAPASKNYLIMEIFSHPNRVNIATHDSGNFVIQRAIEMCPEELLSTMVEGVTAVALLTPHGAKMQKKVQGRMARAGQVLPPSAYGPEGVPARQPSQQPQSQPQPQQHPYGTPVHMGGMPPLVTGEYGDPYDPSFGAQYTPYCDYSTQAYYEVPQVTAPQNPKARAPVCDIPSQTMRSGNSSTAPSSTPVSTPEESSELMGGALVESWADATDLA